MALKIGFVGLPNVGKSTLFSALTELSVPKENFPFCTIDPNVGVVPIPDERLQFLASTFHSQKTVPTTIEFVDIAGLVKGAHEGAGLGNQFLSNIKSVDAILQVVRCFDNPDVIHVLERPDPPRDVEIIELELILSDLAYVEKRIQFVTKNAKPPHPDFTREQYLEALKSAKIVLEKGILLRVGVDQEMFKKIYTLENLLTIKPILYVANLGESGRSEDEENLRRLLTFVQQRDPGAQVIPLSARLEDELKDLDPESRKVFRSDLGLGLKSGLEKLIIAGYQSLNLITFFTAGPSEARAWTVRRGSKAPEAAGKIHSDFEKGFIKAEVYQVDDLRALGSELKIKEQGRLRIEGRDYEVKDGDVILFRFNV